MSPVAAGRGTRSDAAHACAFVASPYEATASFVAGCVFGPAALAAELEAAARTDLRPTYRQSTDWTWVEAHHRSVVDPAVMRRDVERWTRDMLAAGRRPILVGGEHTVTAGALAAFDDPASITVVQFDAHADLRESYDGSKLSHACVMRRAYELGRPLTLLGVRSYSQDEYQLLRVAPRLKLFKAKELHTPEGWQAALDHLKAIPGPVYLSIDLDALDPGIMPAVGTPEPGGLSYGQVLTIIETLAERGPIIGLDLVELAPIPGQQVSEFTAARLLYKALGYIYHERLK